MKQKYEARRQKDQQRQNETKHHNSRNKMERFDAEENPK